MIAQFPLYILTIKFDGTMSIQLDYLYFCVLVLWQALPIYIAIYLFICNVFGFHALF